MNRQADGLGIEVVDVRLRRADLPEQNSQAVFQRMQTERQREAADIRAQGSQLSQTIKAGADRDVTVLRADASRRADELRGTGEAERNRITAEAFGRDPELLRVLPLDAGVRGLDALWRYADAPQPGFVVLPVFQRPAPVQGPAADRAGCDCAGSGSTGSWHSGSRHNW